jgi:hypothetical protein
VYGKVTVMRSTAGRVILGLCGLIVAAAGFFLVTRVGGGRGAAVQDAVADAGRFRSGWALGLDRAGFSGLPMVTVLADGADAGWPALRACLEDAAVSAELGSYTPVLVDAAGLDPESELAEHWRRGHGAVVRALSGQFLGSLPQGFTCEDLVALLETAKWKLASEPQKSPIYVRLLESPEAIDWFVANGRRAEAEKFAAFLREFEGAESPAVQAVESRLGR